MSRTKLKKFKQKIGKYKAVGADSMLFSYYFYGESPYADLAEIIIGQLLDNALIIYTSIISYLEPLSFPELEDDIDKISYIKAFLLDQKGLKIRTLDLRLADEAVRLRRVYRLSTPDAIQYASATIDNAEIFITNDKHFQKLEEKEKPGLLLLDEYVNR